MIKIVYNIKILNFSEMYVFDVDLDKLFQIMLFFKVKYCGRVCDVFLGMVYFGYCVNVESEYKYWE